MGAQALGTELWLRWEMESCHSLLLMCWVSSELFVGLGYNWRHLCTQVSQCVVVVSLVLFFSPKVTLQCFLKKDIDLSLHSVVCKIRRASMKLSLLESPFRISRRGSPFFQNSLYFWAVTLCFLT